MIYTYKAKFDYLLIVFLMGGATLISFLLGLNYIEIIFFDIVVLSFAMLINSAFLDTEIRIDSQSKTMEYVHLKWFKKRKEIFKLEDLNYEYKNVFTTAGAHNQFFLKKGTDIVIKPRANLYSFNIGQIEDIIVKLKELGVQGEDKT